MLTGGEILVKGLEAEGGDILFGYPGAAICPFYDALSGSPLRHVLVRRGCAWPPRALGPPT